MQNLLTNTSSKTIVVPKTVPPKEAAADILESKYTSIKKTTSPTHVFTSRLKSNQFALPKLPKIQMPAHAHLLVIAAIGYLLIVYIFLRVHPQSIAHFLLPNSYLPLLLIFLFANFCLFTFIFHNTRRGLLLALLLTTYLFLQLQQFLTIKTALISAAAFLIYELVISILNNHRVSSSHRS